MLFTFKYESKNYSTGEVVRLVDTVEGDTIEEATDNLIDKLFYELKKQTKYGKSLTVDVDDKRIVQEFEGNKTIYQNFAPINVKVKDLENKFRLFMERFVECNFDGDVQSFIVPENGYVLGVVCNTKSENENKTFALSLENDKKVYEKNGKELKEVPVFFNQETGIEL